MTVDFVEALTEAPLGVALLAEIESQAWPRWRRRDAESDAEAVELAVNWVEEASVGEVLRLAVWVGDSHVSPWNSDAPVGLAAYYRCAEIRRPIAAAVGQKCGDVLHAPMDTEGQEWWTTDQSPRVSGSLEIGGLLWTVSRLPPEVHDEILLAWEFHYPPTSRWQVEIEGRPRVKEIHRPSDWVKLVERWPDADAPMCERFGDNWAFKSPRPPTPRPLLSRLLSTRRRRLRRDPHDPDAHNRELLNTPGQHAAYLVPTRLVGVDWHAAAEHYDAVHVSWAGFLTTEGYVSDLADGSVTMLRGFASERTLWLTDRFAVPVPASPLDAPEGLTEEGACRDLGINVAEDDSRAAWDMINLEVLLGRREAPSPQLPD